MLVGPSHRKPLEVNNAQYLAGSGFSITGKIGPIVPHKYIRARQAPIKMNIPFGGSLVRQHERRPPYFFLAARSTPCSEQHSLIFPTSTALLFTSAVVTP
jgi:hypothetical protein